VPPAGQNSPNLRPLSDDKNPSSLEGDSEAVTQIKQVDDAALEKLARAAGDLPAMPDVVDKVLSLVQDPNSEVEDLKKVIEHDPGLTSKLLRVANSAYYQRAREIASLNQAILTLGFKTLLSLTLASSTKTMFDQYNEVARQLRQKMWEHSISTAFLASMISRQSKGVLDQDLCFLGGLLHDVGKLVIGRNFPTQFARIRTAIDQHGKDQRETEEEILGFTHENLGAYLAREWNLPVPLEIAIRCHHDFESAPEHRLDVAVVDLANRLASHLGWNFTRKRVETLEGDPAVLALGLDPARLMDELDDMQSQVVELRQHF